MSVNASVVPGSVVPRVHAPPSIRTSHRGGPHRPPGASGPSRSSGAPATEVPHPTHSDSQEMRPCRFGKTCGNPTCVFDHGSEVTAADAKLWMTAHSQGIQVTPEMIAALRPIIVKATQQHIKRQKEKRDASRSSCDDQTDE